MGYTTITEDNLDEVMAAKADPDGYLCVEVLDEADRHVTSGLLNREEISGWLEEGCGVITAGALAAVHSE